MPRTAPADAKFIAFPDPVTAGYLGRYHREDVPVENEPCAECGAEVGASHAALCDSSTVGFSGLDGGFIPRDEVEYDEGGCPKPQADAGEIETTERQINLVEASETSTGKRPARAAPILVREHHRGPDEVIVADVFRDDCYLVRDLPAPNVSMIDVGAHIGVFARKFQERFPECEIECVEAHPANVPVCGRNCPFAHVRHAALTYATGPLMLHGTCYDGSANTGGSFVGDPSAWSRLPNADEYREHIAVPVCTLEEVMAERGWTRLDVLKLDCEGSEFPILRHILDAKAEGGEKPLIERVGVIVGEWHHEGEMAMLSALFRRRGWHYDVLRPGHIGLFRLSNPKWWNR